MNETYSSSPELEEEEDLTEYKKGGYHPVSLGDRLQNRYTILQKLGWGQFSTVWLAKDNITNTHTALKIQKSSHHYSEAAKDEIRILTKISNSQADPRWIQSLSQLDLSPKYNPIVQLYSDFTVKGPNGKHACMSFEVLGVNLLEILKLYNYKGIPIPLVRTISRQILIGLDYLHRICEVIHTDIKPENILLQLTQAQLQELLNFGYIKNKFPFDNSGEALEENSILGQYSVNGENKIVKRRRYSKRDAHEINEENTRSKSVHSESEEEIVGTRIRQKSWNFDRKIENFPRLKENLVAKIADLGNACWGTKQFSSVIQTRQYRAPEVVLGMKYGFSADMWSFACMVVELITGEFLFDPCSGENYGKNCDHLAQIWETLGDFPIEWAKTGKKFSKYFNRKNKLRNIPELRPWALKDILVQKYKIRAEEAEGIWDFVKGILVYQPDQRLTASECLQHKWLYEEPNYDYYLSDEEYGRYVSQEELREKLGFLSFQ